MTARLIALLFLIIPSVARAADPIRDLQKGYAAQKDERVPRAYHFGSQGPGDVFTNHGSHTNRLIPFYTFGSKVDPSTVTGVNSVYRDATRLKELYGFAPKNTLNPEADYCDQSDFARLQRDAVKKGAKHLFIVWFDGLDWDTTRAAAIAKTGKVYKEGKGSGLIFQDFDPKGTGKFGAYVTSPTHDQNVVNVNNQTVTIPEESLEGGYDPKLAGPNAWSPSKVLGYFKGQSANAADRADILKANGLLHAYTDSSTSAAEFISGVKSYNNGLNVKDNGEFVNTLLFADLQKAGWKVGTATSVPFDHASPAAMYAQNVHRDDYQDLARAMLGLPGIVQATHKAPLLPGLDVVLGTGQGQVASLSSQQRTQGQNAVAGSVYITDQDKDSISITNGGKYVVVETASGVNGGQALKAAASQAAKTGHRLFGLYGKTGLGHLPYRTTDGNFDPVPGASGRAETYKPSDLIEQPTLADLTEAALTVLTAEQGKPFALFVEAGDVDFALHDNNLDNAIGAVYSGEAAIKVIIDWVEAHSNWDESVMVVTGDHGHYLVVDDPGAIAKAVR